MSVLCLPSVKPHPPIQESLTFLPRKNNCIFLTETVETPRTILKISMKNSPKLILLALVLLFPSVTEAQAQFNRFAYSPSFEPDYLGIYYQQTQQIQQLQIEISRQEREIYTIQQQNRFRWFNRWQLIEYQNYMQNRRLGVAQLRWQLSSTIAARSRTKTAF